MLTKEQNERFTEVGKGTPMGELLRRYWMPFATAKQLQTIPPGRSPCWANTWWPTATALGSTA